MRYVVNEMRSIEVHSTDVIWKSCTARGKGQVQAWCEGSVAVMRLKGNLISQDKR